MPHNAEHIKEAQDAARERAEAERQRRLREENERRLQRLREAEERRQEQQRRDEERARQQDRTLSREQQERRRRQREYERNRDNRDRDRNLPESARREQQRIREEVRRDREGPSQGNQGSQDRERNQRDQGNQGSQDRERNQRDQGNQGSQDRERNQRDQGNRAPLTAAEAREQYLAQFTPEDREEFTRIVDEKGLSDGHAEIVKVFDERNAVAQQIYQNQLQEFETALANGAQSPVLTDFDYSTAHDLGLEDYDATLAGQQQALEVYVSQLPPQLRKRARAIMETEEDARAQREKLAALAAAYNAGLPDQQGIEANVTPGAADAAPRTVIIEPDEALFGPALDLYQRDLTDAEKAAWLRSQTPDADGVEFGLGDARRTVIIEPDEATFGPAVDLFQRDSSALWTPGRQAIANVLARHRAAGTQPTFSRVTQSSFPARNMLRQTGGIADYLVTTAPELRELGTHAEAAALGNDPEKELIATAKTFMADPDSWRGSEIGDEMFGAIKQHYIDSNADLLLYSDATPERMDEIATEYATNLMPDLWVGSWGSVLEAHNPRVVEERVKDVDGILSDWQRRGGDAKALWDAMGRDDEGYRDYPYSIDETTARLMATGHLTQTEGVAAITPSFEGLSAEDIIGRNIVAKGIDTAAGVPLGVSQGALSIVGAADYPSEIRQAIALSSITGEAPVYHDSYGSWWGSRAAPWSYNIGDALTESVQFVGTLDALKDFESRQTGMVSSGFMLADALPGVVGPQTNLKLPTQQASQVLARLRRNKEKSDAAEASGGFNVDAVGGKMFPNVIYSSSARPPVLDFGPQLGEVGIPASAPVTGDTMGFELVGDASAFNQGARGSAVMDLARRLARQRAVQAALLSGAALPSFLAAAPPASASWSTPTIAVVESAPDFAGYTIDLESQWAPPVAPSIVVTDAAPVAPATQGETAAGLSAPIVEVFGDSYTFGTMPVVVGPEGETAPLYVPDSAISTTTAPSAPGAQAFQQQPIAAPTSIPAQAPVEIPSNIPAQVPIEVPAQIPAQIPAETPAQVPAEVPVEAPAQIPAEIPAEVPAQIPAEIPAEIPAQVPAEIPAQVPAQIPAEIPANIPAKIPANIPARRKQQARMKAPAQARQRQRQRRKIRMRINDRVDAELTRKRAEGQYPVVVSWVDRGARHTVDLRSGQRDVTDAPATDATARQTFSVLEYAGQPAPPRTLDLPDKRRFVVDAAGIHELEAAPNGPMGRGRGMASMARPTRVIDVPSRRRAAPVVA